MADMYQDPYDVRTAEEKRQTARRRLVYIAVAGVLVVASAHRLAQPLIGGWFGSVEVLERQQEIVGTRAEIRDLEQQIEFLDTDEGKDVEAKKQDLRGPPGEILIRVHPKKQGEDSHPPVGIGTRVQGWVTGAGGRVLDGVRYVWRALQYWFGWEPCEVPPEPVGPPPQEAA